MARTRSIGRALAFTGCLLASGMAWSYGIQNGQVVDDAGQAVQARGVNWFGFETGEHVVHGLWARNWKDMIGQMQQQGFNAVRLPFCPQSLRGTGPGSIDYSRNPDLQGLNSQQILDKVVQEISDRGMFVLLDHHTPDCQAISELWYTPAYSEQQWIADLVFAASRYKGVPGVIGIDLKNEPHGAATWGTGNAATDWNRAAERAAAAVVQAAPRWIVAVEGIGENPSCSTGSGHFWGATWSHWPARRWTSPPTACCWRRTPTGRTWPCSRISTQRISPPTCPPSGSSTSAASCRPATPCCRANSAASTAAATRATCSGRTPWWTT